MPSVGLSASSSSSHHHRREDGYFHTRSPLGASKNPNPMLLLASNIIFQVFGPTVQTVADCLLYHFTSLDDSVDDPGATLSDITSCILSVCSRSGSRTNHESETDVDYPIRERDRILHNLRRNHTSSSWSWNRTKGSDERGYIVDESLIRSSLVILVHHSLVRVRVLRLEPSTISGKAPPPGLKTCSKYAIDIPRILYIPRYARWVDWVRTKVPIQTKDPNSTDAVDSEKVSPNIIAATLVEELCIHGRMLSLELLLSCRKTLEKYDSSLSKPKSQLKEEPQDKWNNPEEDYISKGLIQVFQQLIDRGFIQLAPPTDPLKKEGEQVEKEAFGTENNPTAKDTSGERLSGQKRTLADMQDPKHNPAWIDANTTSSYYPYLFSMMESPRFKRYFPTGAVWRIHADMFHDTMRAHYIGRLVHERFGDQVTSAGHIITSALKCIAHRLHSPTFPLKLKDRGTSVFNVDATIFTPEDIVEYMSPPIISSFQSKPGGVLTQLSMALVSLSRMNNPSIILEVEQAQGHPKGGKFDIKTRHIMNFMKRMIARQMIRDHLGEIPARITSILESMGYAESEIVAEAAMIPSKDAREALHRLYKSNYIDLMGIQSTKQHNPGTAIYLWGLVPHRLQTNILHNVCRAFYNIRLRQQHEVHIGRQWLERAGDASTADENEVEMDKIRYNTFMKGLERLDQACIHLDETLMALTAF